MYNFMHHKLPFGIHINLSFTSTTFQTTQSNTLLTKKPFASFSNEIFGAEEGMRERQPS